MYVHTYIVVLEKRRIVTNRYNICIYIYNLFILLSNTPLKID